MVFYICMGLAGIVTALIIASCVKGGSFPVKWESPIHAVLALALIDTCILYIPWFLYSWRMGDGEFRNKLLIIPFMIIRLMQTVSMDADYESALEIAGLAAASGASPSFLRFYCIVLSYVSVLVPVSGILTIVNIFGNKIGYLVTAGRLSAKKRFYVFNGIGERNLRLAESIYRKEEGHTGECAFLFCNVREEPGMQALRLIRSIRGWHTADYPSTLLKTVTFMRSRTIEYFLLEEENRNYNDAVNILKEAGKFSGGRELWPAAGRVQVHLLLKSDQLDNIMDTQNKYGIMFRIMNLERMYACDLFERWPLFVAGDHGKEKTDLMIIGRGSVAEKILLTAVWMGRTAGPSLRITYVGDDAELLEEKLRMSCPALFDPALAGGESYELYFENVSEYARLNLQKRDILKTDYAVIIGDNDEENVKIAMWMRTWLARRMEETAAQPFIAVCVRDGRRAEQAEKLRIQESRQSYDLHVFGTESRLFTAEKILDSDRSRSLQRMQASGGIAGPGLSLSPGDLKKARVSLNQSVYNYRSTEAGLIYAVNRIHDSGALAEYMRRREAAEGLPQRTAPFTGYEQARFFRESVAERMRNPSGNTLNGILSVYDEMMDNSGILERLAVQEHRRWIAYMAVNGWIAMPLQELRRWRLRHPDSNKDYLRMCHACMTSWEGLREAAEIATDGRDTEYYRQQDRNLVRRVKWFTGG